MTGPLKVVGGWFAAVVIWLVGVAVVANLATGAQDGRTLSAFDRLTRLDLPWVVISLLMVIATGIVYRDMTRTGRWLAVILPVPVLATVLSAVGAAAVGGMSAVAVILYVVEGAAGAGLGLLGARLIGSRAEQQGGYL
ncbi:hypothetical protein AB0L06_00310 [Spirillospora sp. NPDC052269]